MSPSQGLRAHPIGGDSDVAYGKGITAVIQGQVTVGAGADGRRTGEAPLLDPAPHQAPHRRGALTKPLPPVEVRLRHKA